MLSNNNEPPTPDKGQFSKSRMSKRGESIVPSHKDDDLEVYITNDNDEISLEKSQEYPS